MGSAPRRSGQPPRGEAGQGLAEYALILALIAVVAIVALAFMGTNLQHTLSMIGSSVHIQ
jgi:Flp pilus assembly pilin Flp